MGTCLHHRYSVKALTGRGDGLLLYACCLFLLPYIIAWKLCAMMKAEDLEDILQLAIKKTGSTYINVISLPRMLSPNGLCYVSRHLKEYWKFHFSKP